jgi:hypothetical protein
MKIELSVDELKDIQTALVSQEKMLRSDEVLFKKIGLVLLGEEEENMVCPDCAGCGYVEPTRGEPDGATCVECGGSGKRKSV